MKYLAGSESGMGGAWVNDTTPRAHRRPAAGGGVVSAPQWVTPVDPDAVAGTAEALFRSTFGGAADGVWTAPGRVNLIGEHVTTPADWYCRSPSPT